MALGIALGAAALALAATLGVRAWWLRRTALGGRGAAGDATELSRFTALPSKAPGHGRGSAARAESEAEAAGGEGEGEGGQGLGAGSGETARLLDAGQLQRARR